MTKSTSKSMVKIMVKLMTKENGLKVLEPPYQGGRECQHPPCMPGVCESCMGLVKLEGNTCKEYNTYLA